MAKSKNVGRIGNIPFDEKAALKKMEERLIGVQKKLDHLHMKTRKTPKA